MYISTKNRAFLYFGDNIIDGKGVTGDVLIPMGRWKWVKNHSVRINMRGYKLIYEQKFKDFILKHTIDLKEAHKDICSLQIDQKFFKEPNKIGYRGPWKLYYCEVWDGNHWAAAN